MILVRHELRQGRAAWIVWTLAISIFLTICVSLFPELREQTMEVNEIFSSMGSFTAAFGMDRLNIGTLIGFYTVECGTILGLGGGCYAALMGVTALAKEEREKTAEFLLVHPVRRQTIVTEKLAALVIQITALNLVTLGIALSCIAAVGEEIPWKELLLLHLALYLLQLEIGALCFGISAFLRQGGAGIGLGTAVTLYFLNIVTNITDSARFLRFLTPYAYAEGANIIADGNLKWELVAVGLLYGGLAVLLAYGRYTRKDIHV